MRVGGKIMTKIAYWKAITNFRFWPNCDLKYPRKWHGEASSAECCVDLFVARAERRGGTVTRGSPPPHAGFDRWWYGIDGRR